MMATTCVAELIGVDPAQLAPDDALPRLQIQLPIVKLVGRGLGLRASTAVIAPSAARFTASVLDCMPLLKLMVAGREAWGRLRGLRHGVRLCEDKLIERILKVHIERSHHACLTTAVRTVDALALQRGRPHRLQKHDVRGGEKIQTNPSRLSLHKHHHILCGCLEFANHVSLLCFGGISV